MTTHDLFSTNDCATLERSQAIDALHEATAIYTASPVVERMLARLAWPDAMKRCIDSSCGDGQFLVSALSKALQHKPYTDDELLQILQGWEIHPIACSIARYRVAATLISFGRGPTLASTLAEKMVHNKDFLTEGPTQPVAEVIIGNPPYLRWLNVPKLLRDEYEQHVPTHATNDLLHSFLDRCARVLHGDGEIALVTADRWLTNMGAKQLRAELGRHQLGIEYLARLEAGSVFYRPKQKRAGTPARVHPVEIHLRRGHAIPLTADAIYPGVDYSVYEGLPTLGDLATVRIAAWLGTPGVFVLSKDDAAAAGIPQEYLVPAIDTDDIAGDELTPPTRYAIRTTPDQAPHATIMQHLERTAHKMAARGRGNKLWLPPERFHNMDLSQPSLLVPRIAKTPRGVLVPPGMLPINHNLSIVTANIQTLTRIKKALSSDLAARWVREHAAPLEGDYFSLTTTLLRKLPLDISACD